MRTSLGMLHLSRRQFVRLSAELGVIVLVGIPFAKTMADSLDTLGEDHYASRYDPTTNTRIIEATDLELKPEMMVNGKNLIVRADTLRIRQPLSLPGCNITLVAREISCEIGARLSTVGPKGKPDYAGIQAPMDQNGANDAGAGSRAGDVSIFAWSLTGTLAIDATGGDGGDAQSGGKGSQGEGGTAADHDHAAGPGHQGNKGGNAGRPGDGAPGGQVLIAVQTGVDSHVWSATVKGGQPGKPGVNGTPGLGGWGGARAGGVDVKSYRCPPT